MNKIKNFSDLVKVKSLNESNSTGINEAKIATYDDQLKVGRVIKKATGVKVYFDNVNMVDDKTNKTIMTNALDGTKTIEDLTAKVKSLNESSRANRLGGKLLSFDEFINEGKGFNFAKFSKADDDLAIKLLKGYWGNGEIDGEDFYPSISKDHDAANDKLTDLINKGKVVWTDEENYLLKIVESRVSEGKDGGSGDKKEYQAYFSKLLKKYGADSPEDLSDGDKKKFFDEVDKGWEGDSEKNESMISEKSAKETISAIYKKAFGDKFDQAKVDKMITDLKKKYPELDDEGLVGVAQNSLAEESKEKVRN